MENNHCTRDNNLLLRTLKTCLTKENVMYSRLYIPLLILLLITMVSCSSTTVIRHAAMKKKVIKRQSSKQCQDILYKVKKPIIKNSKQSFRHVLKTTIPEINSLLNSSNKSLNKKEGDSENVIMRYQAMEKIIQHAEFALRAHDSGEAINFLLIGKHYFPHHGKIKRLYSFSIDEFIRSTIELVKKDCILATTAEKRISFVAKIAPDTIGQFSKIIKRCNIGSRSIQMPRRVMLKNFAQLLNLKSCEEEERKESKGRLDLQLKTFLERSNLFPIEKLLIADLELMSKIKFKIGDIDIDKGKVTLKSAYVALRAPVGIINSSLKRIFHGRWVSCDQKTKRVYRTMLTDEEYKSKVGINTASYIGDNKGEPGVQGYSSKYYMKVSKPFYEKISSIATGRFVEPILPITNISLDGKGNYFYKIKLHFKDNSLDVVKGRLHSRGGVFGTLVSLGNGWCSGIKGNAINPTDVLADFTKDSDSIRNFQLHAFCSQHNLFTIEVKKEILSKLSYIEFELDLERTLRSTLKNFGMKTH